MNVFKGWHFSREIILWAVHWYCKYCVSVDHTTLYRWVQRYAPEMEKRLRWYWRQPSGFSSWHLDETYIKVNVICTAQSTAEAIPLISISPHAATVKPHTALWGNS
ncbi:transposase [Buttiauxella gaviniae ATCC 51604]|uniref:Transposase n=1 Tax=Buttiauxella gaviniae ATCC 51604 TaxID=1354253 RepID=A0A1B7HKU7_9ENTR|nr:transposase [Buttiauxella gaviniae ATCC 51604]